VTATAAAVAGHNRSDLVAPPVLAAGMTPGPGLRGPGFGRMTRMIIMMSRLGRP
jgi:hypothetical protein